MKENTTNSNNLQPATAEGNKLFTPYNIGPLTLRNRTIRAAAFEGMCPGNAPSDMLHDYHVAVARGGIGMTTLAYAAVTRSGLSFPHQLWLRREIIPGLRRITDPRRGSRGIYSSGALREYVPSLDMWLYASLRVQRFQYLFAHARAGNETGRDRRYGTGIWQLRASCPRGGIRCRGDSCRAWLFD